MSQHSAIVDDDQADSKPVGRSRWRDRLFSSESWRGKIVEEQGNSEDEVAQFLGVPTTKIPSPPNAKVQLDTSIKLQTPTAPLESDLSPIQDYYRRPRPPLRKGLTVSFVETAPIIIGEGGDEAELPARDVAKAPGVHGFHDAQHSLALRRRSTGYSNHDHRTADMHDAAKSWGQISNGYTRETPSSYTLPEKEKHPSSRGGRSLRGTSHDESAPVKDSKRDPLSWQDAGFKIPQTPDTHRMASTKHSVQKGHSPNRTPSPQTQRPSKTASPSPSRVVNARDIQPAINPVAEWVAASEERGTSPSHARPGGKTRDLRTIAKGLGQDALDEFDVCVATVSGYFKASVSAKQDLMDISFSAWIRAATWWFLKGRQELETAVRSKAQSRRESEGNDEESPSRSVMQAYVDLAKARWIVQDVAPNHPDVKKYGNASMPSMVAIIENFGDKELSDLVEVHIAIVANLRALTMSMKRNGRLPPQPFEIQGQDTRIFLEYPNLPRHAVEHDKGASMKSSDRAAVSTIPVGDTKRYFYMARAFMKSTLVNRQRGREEVRIPCIMSILQDKQQGDLIARVTSQDGQLNFLIGPTSSKHYSLTWRQLQWVKSSNTISIPLSRDFELQSVLAEKDFENVWEMCGSYQKAKVAFAKEDHEQLFFECTLHHFERLETPNEAGAFPQGSIRGCGMRVFLRKAGAVDQPTARRKFRLVVTTPPDIKSLRALSTEFASDRIIVLGTCSPEDGPSLTMRTASNPALLIGFNSEGELGIFRTLICNSSTTATDVWFEPWALRRYAVDNASRSADSLQSSNELLKRFPWRSIQIIERRQEQQQNVQSLHSKCLRLVVDSGHGLMVDVLNTHPGDIQIGLNTEDYNELHLLLPPQSDVTWTIEDKFNKAALKLLNESLKATMASSSIRIFQFTTLYDAHDFQARLTGFSVLYDGHAAKLDISRRRSVVPIHKHWETTAVRLQILQRDKATQIAAFFRDFQHGSCMSFEIKATNVFESSNRSGAFLLRLVDAKFALPKKWEDASQKFICLDIPEYPTEHDDITLTFDNEEARDSFASCLPAPVSKPSRLGTLRR